MNVAADADRRGGHGGTSTVPWMSPALLLATCGGVGRAPVAPGTVGSAVGVALAVATGAAASTLAGPGATALAVAGVETALLAVISLVGVPICSRGAALLGRGKDPGAVVFDEMAALPVVLLPVPPAARSVACLVAAFVLFRAFDIAKPFPCRLLERLPAGWGIMADDLAAAAWAGACLALARALGLV